MSNRKTVMIADNDKSTCKFIAALLQTNEYLSISVPDGDSALTMVSSHVPDLILLDLDLPDIEGIEVIRNIRQWSNMPIIVVSARNHELDKITALDAGADDYVTKPFGGGELLARIRAALRNSRLNVDDEIHKLRIYKSGALEIDFDKYIVKRNNETVHLTKNEFKIMQLLAKYSGKVLTYEYILKQIWGPFAREDNKTLRVNMANLRKKLESDPTNPQYLFTEPGIGYKMKEGD